MSNLFWLKVVTSRLILVLSRLSTQERQLEFLQDLVFYITKLQRAIKVDGRLEGMNDRVKEEEDV